jgi:cytochrome c oxidase subunit 3
VRTLHALLGATAVLGIAFLAIKGFEYRLEWIDGHRPGSDLFSFLYWVMTGVHARHLAVGIALVLWLLRAADAMCTEVVGLYWHFVDIVWIFLFPMIHLVGRHG